MDTLTFAPSTAADASRRPHAVVIGSGFGGLAAAVRLGARGYRVTVLERLDAPGGRAYVYRQDGFTFDAGPTIVTAPFLFEELWQLCGRRMADDVELRPVTPFYRIRFDDGTSFDYSGDAAAMQAEVARLAPDDVAGYARFMAASERIFRVGFEQVCHRLTTLRRPGAEGVPFHMLRIDVAGNISKRFSASGIRFARFSGACPRWNVFSAFLTPGMIRIQVSRMPDGHQYFCIARTIQKDSGGYHAQHAVQAIGLGCRVEHARELVYSDGIDVANPDTCIPVGITCRLCERTDCEQRALPSLKVPLQVDQNVRGVSLYAPVGK